MAKKKTKTKIRSAKKKSVPAKKSFKVVSPSSNEKLLRDHLISLLKEGAAHATFDDVLSDWPVQLAGVKVANFPHTAWMLLEHIRIALWDILEFSRNPKHVSPKWPEGYWPESEAPTSEKAWQDSAAAVRKDLLAMQNLVARKSTDLCAKFPWGDGQTLLREALLVADHNAYHLGQLAMLRKSIGI